MEGTRWYVALLLIVGVALVCDAVIAADFPVWKTVNLKKTQPEDWIDVLENDSLCVSVGERAEEVIRATNFRITGKVDLALVTVSDLGFTEAPRFEEVFARAASFGLKRCPVDVVPQLRLDYADQAPSSLDGGWPSDWVKVGMEPAVLTSDSSLQILALERTSLCYWILTVSGSPLVPRRPLDEKFIFMK
jgi:hypothetical protein